MMQQIIPNEHREKLIALDYIAERLGGLALTNTGRMRLAAGR
jgi:hypothetical protein